MNNRRNFLAALGASVIAAPLSSFAQQQGKIWRIGFLGLASAVASTHLVDALRAGLRDHGYVEGRNIVIEYRWADGKYERLPELAAELVRLKVEVIVGQGTPGSLAAKQATTTIPIIMATSADPIGSGLVASLARPGGNVTGLSNLSGDLGAKSLEILLSIAPKLSRVAVLMNPLNSSNITVLKGVQNAVPRAEIKILPMEARTAQEIETAFSTMTQQKAGAIIVVLDPFLNQQARQIAELAVKNRLPSIGGNAAYAEAGCLMSYGSSQAYDFRRAATYVDKILKGTKPGELPVEQPTKLELIINGKTANALGLKIPQSLLISADKVIE
jgi:putative ABC transport system substrate-binding protein